jgi:DNA-3-methyladenine glycosylase
MNPGTAQQLTETFYQSYDVLGLASALLGKVLVSDIGRQRCTGIIVETEAYRGADDRACHAYPYRRTPRTEVMFRAAGHAYIYLCYGIHHLFNVVAGPEGQPDAVLVRALEPLENLELMLERRSARKASHTLCGGPGALSQALGLHTGYSGTSLVGLNAEIRIEDRGIQVHDDQIYRGTRVGVAYAGTCAQRPWRFHIEGSPWVSRAKGA